MSSKPIALMVAMFALLEVPAALSQHSVLRPPAHQMRQYEIATHNTVREVLRRLEPLLSPSEKARFASVRVDVQSNSWDIYGISVSTSGGASTVVVPLGLIYILDHIDSAALLSESARIPQDRMTAYLRLLVERAQENEARRMSGQSLKELPSFPAFAGITEARVRQVESNPQYSASKDALKLSSFAFFIFHEIAHLIVPEAMANVEIQARERAADEFALRNGLAADFNPMLAFYSFGFYAALEDIESPGGVSAGYDTALCRGAKFFVAGVESALRDREFVSFMRSRGQLDEVRAAPAKIAQLLRDDQIRCELQVPVELREMSPTADERTVDVQLRIWRPSPGSCSGASGELWIDGEHATDFDNTVDTDDLELGDLTIGSHEFSFQDVSAYCIAPYPPYPMNTAASDLRCSGRFSVKESGRLRMAMTLYPNGRLSCSIR